MIKEANNHLALIKFLIVPITIMYGYNIVHSSLRMLSIERNKPPASFTSTTPVKDYVKDTVDGYERCINLLKSSWHPSSCDLLIPIIPLGLMYVCMYVRMHVHRLPYDILSHHLLLLVIHYAHVCI